MVWLPYGVKSLRIRLAMSTEYRRMTDRHPAMHHVIKTLRNTNIPDEDILEFFVQHYFALLSPCHGISHLDLV